MIKGLFIVIVPACYDEAICVGCYFDFIQDLAQRAGQATLCPRKPPRRYVFLAIIDHPYIKIEAHGQIECTQDPTHNCVESHGELRCGLNCRVEVGSIECDG